MLCGLVIYKHTSTPTRTKYQTTFLFGTGFWGKEENSLVKEGISLVQQGQELDLSNTMLCCRKNKGFISTSPTTFTNNTQLYGVWLQWTTTRQHAIVLFKAAWREKERKQQVTGLLSSSHQNLSCLY